MNFKTIFTKLGIAALAITLTATSWILFSYNTITYLTGLIIGAAIIPIIIGLFGPTMPYGLRKLLSKLHWILMATANGHKPYYLIQTKDKNLEIAYGDNDNKLYHRGGWHDIEDGYTNQTRFGWRPFGILLEKNPIESLSEIRVDSDSPSMLDAEQQDIDHNTRRAKIPEDTPSDFNDRHSDDEFLVDMKQVVSGGQRFGARVDFVQSTGKREMQHQADVSTDSKSSLLKVSVVAAVFGAMLGFMHLTLL